MSTVGNPNAPNASYSGPWSPHKINRGETKALYDQEPDFRVKHTDYSRQHGAHWDRNNSFDSLGLQTRVGISHGKKRQQYDPTRENINQGKSIHGYGHRVDHPAYWDGPQTESHKHLYPETHGKDFKPERDDKNFDPRPKNIPQERKIYGGSSQIYACMTDVSTEKDRIEVERPMTAQGRAPEKHNPRYEWKEPVRPLGVEETTLEQIHRKGGSSRAKQLFERFDRDGNGTIDIDEFRAMAYILGMYPDDERGNFASIDTDGSGGISWTEFETWWARVGGTFSDAEFDAAVRPFTSPVRSPTKKEFTSWNGVDGLQDKQWEKDCFRPMVKQAPDVLNPNLPCTATKLPPASRAALNPWESHKLW